MLWKTFEEPGTRSLPYLRKCFIFKTFFSDKLFKIVTGVKCSPLVVLCRSCIATQHVADCYTVFHIWYTYSTRWEKTRILQLTSTELLYFLNYCVKCSRRVCLTHLFAVLTHRWADPRWTQLLPTQQTAVHSIPTHSLFHVIQPVYQAPATAHGETFLKMSLLIIPWLHEWFEAHQQKWLGSRKGSQI